MNGPNLFGLPKVKKEKPESDSPVHRLIMLYVGLFQERFNEKPMASVSGRDGKALKEMIAVSDEATVARRLKLYLELDDVYLADAGYPLHLMPGVWNRLIAQTALPRGGSRVPDFERTEAYLRSLRRR